MADLTNLHWEFTQSLELPAGRLQHHQVVETSVYEVDPSLFQSTEMFLYKQEEPCHLEATHETSAFITI